MGKNLEKKAIGLKNLKKNMMFLLKLLIIW